MEETLKIIAVFLTLATIIFGIIQYRNGLRWKRLEFVAKEINDFESDKDIRNAK